MRVLGVDIGGTFTDFVLLDLATGALFTHKVLTTPAEPERAVLEGTRELLARAQANPPDRVVHGTTLVTNAIVERKGAVTALLTTRGFRDVLEIRREGRYDLYDLDLEFPELLVPRRRRYEALERSDETGAVVEPLDEAALDRLLETVKEAGIESWAVAFLHAYANPEPERRAGEILARHFPGMPVSLSGAVAPEIREYERTSTVVANAYVRPVAERYLGKLEAGFRELGAAGLQVMQSDGGITSPAAAALHPIRIVESGPSGGVIAAERLRLALGEAAVLSLDMGGTTAKIAFLDGAGPRTRSLFEVDRRHLYKKGSGIPLLAPSLDLVEIGAGGGSLARPGPLGTLAVGPQSAGADPGPACYGRGGRGATVTDADLVLGLLDPAYFLGGAMPLDPQAARSAVERDVAHPLRLSTPLAAHGVHLLVGSTMAEAARVHAAERGLDLAAHALIAYGGAGPVHAWSVARRLRIRRILFPGHAGVESALGFLAAPPAFEVARSRPETLEAMDAQGVSALLEVMRGEARAIVERAGSGTIRTQIAADMRYRGQGAEVRVALEEPEALRPERLRAAFLDAYAALYGRAVEGVPIEIVTWRVRCRRDAPAIAVLDEAGRAVPPRDPPAPFGEREAWIPDEQAPAPVPVYRREQLEPGMRLVGPALIQEIQSTLVLGRGEARVLAGGTVLAEVAS